MKTTKKSWQQKLVDESQYYEQEVRRLQRIVDIQENKIKVLENQIKGSNQIIESCHLISQAAGEVAHSVSTILAKLREGRV